jgi:hypothetical protein
MARAYMVKMRTVYSFSQKHEGKRPLRRSRHRWDDNIRMDLKRIGWESVWDCIHSSVVGSCEHGNETLGSIKGREFLDLLCDY